jgi:hypothetical protein
VDDISLIKGAKMLENIVVQWGGHERKAHRASYNVTGKWEVINREEKTIEKTIEPLAIIVDGESSTLNDGVDVQVQLIMTSSMV